MNPDGGLGVTWRKGIETLLGCSVITNILIDDVCL